MKYTFPCGCSFDAEEHNGKTFIKPYNELEVPLDCPACWKLVQGGHTLGIFQLDSKSSSLGKFTAKRMIPENEHHLAQLFAIVRPGCMDAKIDDVSVTQHFMKRKNGDEEIHPIHPAISDITAPTQEFMIYQEQAMYVAQKIAGFSGSEGYALVKAAAKKKPELMAKMREKFIAGCKAVALVNEDDANRIFDQIEASQRYSFNQSHSYAYALDSYYYSIYPKAHFPKAFYVAQLNNIKNLEEVRPIITEALELGVQILPPNATSKNTEFKIENGKIRFGLNHIKGSDSKSINKLANEITPNPTLSECLMLLTRLNKRATDGLIKAGAFSFLGISRSTLLHWLETLKKLNGEAQREFVLSFESIDVGLNELLCITPGRGKLLSTSVSLKAAERVRNYFDKPPTSLDDSIQQIFRWETEFLGYPFTSHEVDVYNALPTDFTCKDLKGLS